MIFWILIIILLWLIISYSFIFVKRIVLKSQISKKCKSLGINIEWKRHFLASVFSVNGKCDFVIPRLSLKGSIITTRFKRSIYHFHDEHYMDIIKKKFLLLVGHRRIGAVKNGVEWDSVRKTYDLNGLYDRDEHKYSERVVIIYPIPYDITSAILNKRISLQVGDDIFKDVRFYNMSGFCQYLEDRYRKRKA